MTVYYSIVIYVIIIIGLSYWARDKQIIAGKYHIDKDYMALFFISVWLILVSGLRYRVGTDYNAYIINYPLYKNIKFQSFGSRIVAILSSWIKDDYSTWFFLMAFLTIGLSIYSISKKKEYWPLTILLYILMGFWHASFNIVKQCMAMAILLACQDFLLEKKFLKWMFACFIATLFHVSAIIMIPVYFLVTRKINKRQIILLVIVGVVISIGYEPLFDIMAFLKSNEGMESINSSVGSREVNILRVIVNVLPAILMVPLRKEYKKTEYDEIRKIHTFNRETEIPYGAELTLWSNFSLLNAVICIAAQNSVYLTRFSNYTGIFNIFFIPFALKYMDLKRKRVIYFALISCYFVFWIYDLSKGSTTVDFHWIFER